MKANRTSLTQLRRNGQYFANRRCVAISPFKSQLIQCFACYLTSHKYPCFIACRFVTPSLYLFCACVYRILSPVHSIKQNKNCANGGKNRYQILMADGQPMAPTKEESPTGTVEAEAIEPSSQFKQKVRMFRNLEVEKKRSVDVRPVLTSLENYAAMPASQFQMLERANEIMMYVHLKPIENEKSN